MSEILTPDKVWKMLKHPVLDVPGRYRLCRDYLTLWDRNKELETDVNNLEHAIQYPDD